MEQLLKLINSGWSISIYNQPKRIDGKWVIRICWKANFDQNLHESEWEGFENAEQCIADVIIKCNELNKLG